MTREEYDRKIEDKKYSLQQQKDRFMAYYHIGKSYIKSLEATIEAKDIIIKDKTAIIDAMTQPKTCEGCFYYDKYEHFNYCDGCERHSDVLYFAEIKDKYIEAQQ